MGEQDIAMQNDFASWEFYANVLYSTMTGAEWVVFFVGMPVAWIIAEYIKRSVVWKEGANRRKTLAIMIPLGGDAHFKLGVVHVISFLITFAITFTLWPVEGLVKHPIMIAIMAGVFNSPLYMLVMAVATKLLVWFKMNKLAAWLCGDKRLLKLIPKYEKDRRLP